jgi:hypothetical protein
VNRELGLLKRAVAGVAARVGGALRTALELDVLVARRDGPVEVQGGADAVQRKNGCRMLSARSRAG